MFEHYKKRFVGMQAFIAVVVVIIYFATNHAVFQAATYFVMMQIGAVVGAAWAGRLSRRVQSRGF